MRFDDDFVAIALIAFLTVVFLGAATVGGEVIQLASGIMEFGLGAIAGYMSRSSGREVISRERLREIVLENKRLKAQLEGANPETQTQRQRRSPHYSGE